MTTTWTALTSRRPSAVLPPLPALANRLIDLSTRSHLCHPASLSLLPLRANPHLEQHRTDMIGGSARNGSTADLFPPQRRPTMRGAVSCISDSTLAIVCSKIVALSKFFKLDAEQAAAAGLDDNDLELNGLVYLQRLVNDYSIDDHFAYVSAKAKEQIPQITEDVDAVVPVLTLFKLDRDAFHSRISARKAQMLADALGHDPIWWEIAQLL